MHLNVITVVSLFAATLSMVSCVTQAWSIVRSRDTSEVSLKMYAVTVTGFITWLIYGVLLMQWAIIVQNVICLALSSIILVMKLLPQSKKETVRTSSNQWSGGSEARRSGPLTGGRRDQRDADRMGSITSTQRTTRANRGVGSGGQGGSDLARIVPGMR